MDEELELKDLAEKFGSDVAQLCEQYAKAGLPLNTQAKILMGGAFDCHETFTGSAMLSMFKRFGEEMDKRYARVNSPPQ